MAKNGRNSTRRIQIMNTRKAISTAVSCTEAFNNAINRGLLTIDSANDYMYMYTRDDADGQRVDVFKNIVTRHNETVTRLQD